MVGMSTEVKRAGALAAVDLFQTVFGVFVGSWLGGKAMEAMHEGATSAKDKTKGRIIGATAGYFATLLMRQNSALDRQYMLLDRIADGTAPLPPTP
jgi:hypothetical protein